MLAAVAVIAVLATTALVLALTRSAGAGPFADADACCSGVPVKIGQFGVATIVLPRTLTKPAVLLDVHPLHPEDAAGLTLRYAAGTRGLQPGLSRGWNIQPNQLRSLAGFGVPAHRRGGINVGVASKRAGVYTLQNLVLDYRIGGTRYSAPMDLGLTICVGPKWWPVGANDEVRSCTSSSTR